MDLINIIIIFLLITPFYAVITDFKLGKIKNYFIFPFLLISILLSIFIKGFYFNSTNIIGFLIVILFGYLFYKDNKWGAGDGKYIILIGLNSLIISYLLGINTNIINGLFISIFGILLIYNILFLLFSIKEIKKIKFENNIKFNFLDIGYIISFIYIFSLLLGKYIGTEYIYIVIFLSVILFLPYLLLIKNKLLKLLFIGLGLFICVVNLNYLQVGFIGIIYLIFIVLQSYAEQMFNIIDVEKIKLYNIKQGIMLTKKSIDQIKVDTKFELTESPLQGDQVFNLIGKYKELGKNPELIIYKELKIGIIMYIGYIITIFYYI